MNRVTIKFHGNLAQFGDSFTLYAKTANEAIRSLAIQIDGLKQYLRKGYYRVQVGNKAITQKEYIGIVELTGDCEIHVSPKVAGSGRWGQFIAGAVLTAIGVYLEITPLIQMGAGMMLGGVAQMLMKPPSFNQDHQGIEESKSSAFTNLQNIVGQGKQMPRIYGNLRVGSVIASQELSSYRPDSSTTSDTIQYPTYTKKRIEPEPAKDPSGNPYKLNQAADSVKEASTTIVTKWS